MRDSPARKTKPSLDPADEIWSPEKLSRTLGVPLRTIYHWNSVGTGPRKITLGRHVRYRKADIERWLDERSTGSPAA